jgi:hypothetical protein
MGIILREEKMNQIDWKDFQKVELRVGTIVDVQDFPEARTPAYKLQLDFGQEIGSAWQTGYGRCQFSTKTDRTSDVRVFGYRLSSGGWGGGFGYT